MVIFFMDSPGGMCQPTTVRRMAGLLLAALGSTLVQTVG